ncbi:MAG: OsmC family protein [Cyclobacteriaceae bacterium]
MKTRLHYIADKEYQSVNEHGNTLSIDMYNGKEKAHQSPMELLLSAVTACAAVDVVEILKKKRKTIDDLRVSAEGNRNPEPPRYFTDVALHFTLVSPDTDKETLEKVVALTIDKYCSVASTIDGKANLSYSVEIVKKEELHAGS